MLVYVVNRNGNKLMPCKPAKARHLLKDGKAKVITLSPFTIQLNWDCEEKVQDITLGVDKGSKTTGFCCVGNGKILLSGNINHRINIKKKMDGRHNNRQARRSRKWHRPPRFNNRASSRRKGRLPPSVRANAEEVIRVVWKMPLPLSRIVVEDVLVDVARLNNPNLRGEDYQISNRLDENLRLATLMRDNFKCTQCKKGNLPLQAHHIIWQSHGGKDTIDNLTALCSKCHKDIHDGKITITGGVSGFRDRMAQRTTQGKTHLYKTLETIAPLSKVFGYQTAEYRKSLNLPKEHDVDALCVATLPTGEIVSHNRHNFYNIKFRAEQTRRRYYELPRKGKGRTLYQVNDELKGFHKGDIVQVKGKWTKQIHGIQSDGFLAFPRVKGDPSTALPRNCRLLQGSPTIFWDKR